MNYKIVQYFVAQTDEKQPDNQDKEIEIYGEQL